jgi:hypothetical protein
MWGKYQGIDFARELHTNLATCARVSGYISATIVIGYVQGSMFSSRLGAVITVYTAYDLQ